MRFHSVVLAIVLTYGCMLVPRATLAQVEIRSGHFLTSDVVKLHYLEAGTGPTLVFVPGWTMPAEIWEHQILHFASSHRVVALDPRGQGRSEKVSHGYHPSRRARDIGELLESLDRPAFFVYSSLDWAVKAAEEVRKGWPNIRVEVIDETSHALFVDKPGEFNRLLGDFLASLPE